MFQYFLKVVSTQFRTLDGKIVSVISFAAALSTVMLSCVNVQVNTHQYSATHFERDLSKGSENNGNVHVAHTISGIPGLSLSSPSECPSNLSFRRILQL